jgi:hypothetical protein
MIHHLDSGPLSPDHGLLHASEPVTTACLL